MKAHPHGQGSRARPASSRPAGTRGRAARAPNIAKWRGRDLVDHEGDKIGRLGTLLGIAAGEIEVAAEHKGGLRPRRDGDGRRAPHRLRCPRLLRRPGFGPARFALDAT